ncbi:MAG: hypothetical protein K2O10_07105, partial [Muribaculaceae bacterium]|nr:hypothetical protein [Muribaculaceae bacterium]
TNGSDPGTVVEQNLTFDGYQNEPAGQAVIINTSGVDSNQAVLAPQGTDPLTDIYYSALVRVDEFPTTSGRPGGIICLTGKNSIDNTFGDGISSTEGGGLFFKKGSSDNKAKVGVCVRNANFGIEDNLISWADKEITLGQTALVVLHYTKTDGENNDLAEVFVNHSQESPGQADATSTALEESLADIRGIAVNQRNNLRSKMPKVIVDELRVATTWDDIFAGDSQPVTPPNVTISENPVDFGQVYCNITVERTITIRATDLTDDITLTTGESGQVSLSKTTIDKDQAMTDAGVELTISLTPVESRYYYDRITVTTPGATDKILNVQWHPVPSTVASTLAELSDEDTHDMTQVYVYKGEATVTFIESYYDLSYDRVVNSIFAQDATGGVELRSANGCGYQEIDISGVQVGDNLTDIVGYLIFGDSGLTLVPRTADDFTVVSHGNTVEPIELTLRQIALAQNGYTYGNQLVRVKNVRFPDEYFLAGEYHGLWNSQKYQIFDGTLDDYDGVAWMWCTKGADYFKTSTEGY